MTATKRSGQLGLVVNVRGTHGSGKSTLVREVLSRYSNEPLDKDRRGRPEGYKVEVPWLALPVHVVGPYETACGGCDAIQPYGLIWPRVERYAARGHVLFEGALVSSSYGNIGRASEALGNAFVFAFLDTPLEVCLERVMARRKAKGNLEPFNPRNTEVKHKNVWSSCEKIKDRGDRRVMILSWRKAMPQLLGLYLAWEQQE